MYRTKEMNNNNSKNKTKIADSARICLILPGKEKGGKESGVPKVQVEVLREGWLEVFHELSFQ